MRSVNPAFSLAVCVILSAIPARAGIISMDLVPGSGDGLITYDDVNHREWLDLSQTLGMSFAAVKSELAIGGLFEGWHTADATDVTALAQSAGVDLSSTSYSVNGPPIDNVLALVTPTRSLPGLDQAIGLTNYPLPDAGYFTVFTSYPAFGVAYYQAEAGADPGGKDWIATWLWRPAEAQAVPEPSSLALLGIGASVTACGAARRRQRQTTGKA